MSKTSTQLGWLVRDTARRVLISPAGKITALVHDIEGYATELIKSFQRRVAEWMPLCFTKEVIQNHLERGHRFGEEAVELVQAVGVTREDMHRLVDYVYDRPVGMVGQEVGGVMVTLAALCSCPMVNIDMELAAERELARVQAPEVIERIRQKQETKPHAQSASWAGDRPEEGRIAVITERELHKLMADNGLGLHRTGRDEVTLEEPALTTLARLLCEREAATGDKGPEPEETQKVRLALCGVTITIEVTLGAFRGARVEQCGGGGGSRTAEVYTGGVVRGTGGAVAAPGHKPRAGGLIRSIVYEGRAETILPRAQHSWGGRCTSTEYCSREHPADYASPAGCRWCNQEKAR